MIVFAALAAGIWWTTIRKLSHANVRSNVQRLIVVLIVTPVVWVTSLFLPGCICYTLVVVMTNIENADYGVTLIASIAGIVVLVVARKYMRFVYSNVPEAEF